MGDQHKTERIQLTDLHALGSWPVAVQALRAIHECWVLALRRGVLADIRTLTFAMEQEDYDPALNDQLDGCFRALRHLTPCRSMEDMPTNPPSIPLPPSQP